MVKFYDTRIGRYFRKWKNDKVFSLLSPGKLAIDCGANIGSVTRAMARPGVTVYAFEPDPRAFEMLQSNFKENPNIILINKAVSDHYGTTKIYFNNRYSEDPIKWSTGTTLIVDKPHVDKDNFDFVETIDLADFVKKLDKPVTLLKMDIEGEEIKVLNKLIDSGVISKINKVLVETHERFPTLKEPTEELKKRIISMKLKNIDLNWD
jgi:FkbM family methyltransferase